MEPHAEEPCRHTLRPLRTLNLNLLVPLEPLLRRRSVSPAALRRHFGAELLERRGHELVLTPFGASLLPTVDHAVRSVHAVFDSNAVFDHAESDREFVIAAADAQVQVVAAPLRQAVHQQAPRVRLDFPTIDPAILTDPLSAMRTVNFVSCIPDRPAGYGQVSDRAGWCQGVPRGAVRCRLMADSVGRSRSRTTGARRLEGGLDGTIRHDPTLRGIA